MRIFLCFFVLLLNKIFYTACSPENKDDLIPPTIIDSTDTKGDNTNPPPKAIIVKKSSENEISNFKINLNRAESYYLGSVWSLGDTSKGLEILHLPNKEKKEKIHFLSYNTSVDLENHIPSYDNMLTYAKKFNPGSTTLNFSSGSFFDYGIIQYYLGNGDDYKVVKELVAINDSTYIRKKNGVSRYSLHEYLYIFTDLVEINSIYDENYLNQLKDEKFNPYYISSVTYGAESIFLAETDSTQAAFNSVFDKLINNSELLSADIDVLDASNMLIYRKDSSNKNSFIKFGKGSSEIRNYIKEFNDLNKRSANSVNFPFSFTLSKLDDMTTLKYKMKYDIFEKVEK
ncbi:MAG: hypothetical protein ACI35V_03015 [Sphingobacterium composti]